MTARIVVEEDHTVIYVPNEDVHGLIVALEECPCRSNKANSTKTIRQRLVQGLQRARARK